MKSDCRQKRSNLQRLLRPRNIAYIGGSQVVGPLAASQTAGFGGEIWVVNPVRDEIGGIQTCARIEDLPQAPDAALVALAAIGAGGVVCMTAGFPSPAAPARIFSSNCNRPPAISPWSGQIAWACSTCSMAQRSGVQAAISNIRGAGAPR